MAARPDDSRELYQPLSRDDVHLARVSQYENLAKLVQEMPPLSRLFGLSDVVGLARRTKDTKRTRCPARPHYS
jgi:hypothetical protein